MAATNTLKVVLEGVDKVSGTVTGIENRFKKLQKVMTAVIAVGTAQKFADMAVEGAKFRAQLKGIGGDGLKVQKELRDLQEGLNDSFSMASLVSAKAKIKAFNLDLKFTPTILKNIQSRAMLMGIDTSYALESVTTGISRQSNKWLDNIGIIVKSDQAYLKMANSLGKTTKELTAQEKQTAFTNAAIEAMSGRAAEVPAVTLAAQQAQARWADAWAHLNDAFAETLPLLASLADTLKEVFAVVANIFRPILKAISALLTPVVDALNYILGHLANVAKMLELAAEITADHLFNIERQNVLYENQKITQEGIKFTANDIAYIYDAQSRIQETIKQQKSEIVALMQKEKELAQETSDLIAKFNKKRFDIEIKLFNKMSLRELRQEKTRAKFTETRTRQIEAEHKIRDANIKKEFRVTMAAWELQHEAQKELLRLEKSRAAVRITSLEAVLGAQYIEMKNSGNMSELWLETWNQSMQGVAAMKADLDGVGKSTEKLIANHEALKTELKGNLDQALDASLDLAIAQHANIESEYKALIASKSNTKSKKERLKTLKDILEQTLAIEQAEKLFENRQRGLGDSLTQVLALKIKIEYAQKAIENSEKSLDARKAILEKKTLEQDRLDLLRNHNKESIATLENHRADLLVLKGITDYDRQILTFDRDRNDLLKVKSDLEARRDEARSEQELALVGSFNLQIQSNELQLEALRIDEARVIAAEKIRIEADGYYKAGEAFASIAGQLGDFDAVDRRISGAFGFMGQMLDVQGQLTDGSKTASEAFNMQADAVTGLALNFIEGERAKAAVMALKHSALAAANWFNPFAAASHVAAAAAFAAIAGGAGSASSGGGGAAMSEPERDEGGGGGASQIVVNFEGGILGDAATLGQHIALATGQAGKAGYGGAI